MLDLRDRGPLTLDDLTHARRTNAQRYGDVRADVLLTQEQRDSVYRQLQALTMVTTVGHGDVQAVTWRGMRLHCEEDA